MYNFFLNEKLKKELLERTQYKENKKINDLKRKSKYIYL